MHQLLNLDGYPVSHEVSRDLIGRKQVDVQGNSIFFHDEGEWLDFDDPEAELRAVRATPSPLTRGRWFLNEKR